MKSMLGHDIAVHDMERSCLKALKNVLFVQEQTSEMELFLVHSLLVVFLDFKCQAFGHHTIDGSR